MNRIVPGAFTVMVFMLVLTGYFLLSGGQTVPDPVFDSVTKKKQTISLTVGTETLPAEEKIKRMQQKPKMTDSTSAVNTDWPFFRGSLNGTGKIEGVLSDQPEVLWTYSCGQETSVDAPAVIAGDSVFIADCDGAIRSLSLDEGKVRWQVKTTGIYQGSPLVNDGVLFVGDLDGNLLALDAKTGVQRWKRTDCGSIKGGISHYKSLILCGNQAGELVAVHREDGKNAWKYECEDQIQSTPIVIGTQCLIAGCDAVLHIIDAETGKGLKKVELGAPTGTTPAASRITLSKSGETSVAWVGTEGNEFLAIDLEKGRVLWRFDAGKSSVRTPVALSDQMVFFGTQGRELFALNCVTGEKLWSIRGKDRIEAGLLCSDLQVLAVSFRGILYIIESTSGKILSQMELDGAVIATPAVAQGKIVVATDLGTVYCLGEKLKKNATTPANHLKDKK